MFNDSYKINGGLDMPMSKEMMDAVEKDNVVFLATSADNIPNVVPI